MTRRGLVLVAGSLVVAACAPGPGIRPGPDAATATTSSAPTTTTTLAPEPDGGTVVIGLDEGGSPRTLNPFLEGPDLAVLDTISPAIAARGWIADPVTGAPIPEALVAIPSPGSGTVVDAGDGTITVRAEVRPEARWADGTPITAVDLAFTIEVAVNPDLPIRRDLADRYALVIPGSVQTDGRSITFRMQATTAYERLFDIILPRHVIDVARFATDWTERAWVSGGPFQVAQFVPGQLLLVERNAAYWRRAGDGDPLPRLDRVVFRFSESGGAADPGMLEGFTAGDLDVVTIAAAQEHGVAFRSVPGATVTTSPGPIWEFLTFQFGPGNRNGRSQNRHLAFRQAIAHAIDRDALAVARGTAPVTSVLGRFGVGAGVGAWERYPFDQQQVLARLDDLDRIISEDPFAGDGLDVVITVPGDSPAGVATAGRVVSQLRDAGFAAELQLEDATIFFGPTLDNGSWDVGSWGLVSAPGVTAAAALLAAFDPDGLPFVGANFFRWGTIDSTVSGPAVEAYRNLADDLRVVVEPSAAEVLLRAMEEILADQVVIIPLIVRDDIGAAWRDGVVSGPVLNPYGGIAWNVAEWRRVG